MSDAPTVTSWALDPLHSEVQFKIKPFVISTVTISFKAIRGSAQSQGDDFDKAQVEFSLAADSLDTNQ